MALTKEIYAIWYCTGEADDEYWKGILLSAGMYSSKESAESKVTELQAHHNVRMEEAVREGLFPLWENETYSVTSVIYYYEDI